MLIIYRDQERLDARTAMVIANSLRTQPAQPPGVRAGDIRLARRYHRGIGPNHPLQRRVVAPHLRAVLEPEGGIDTVDAVGEEHGGAQLVV